MFTSTKFARTRQGMKVKTKALAIAMKRKEDYLGARVPKELKERVITRAEELGIPVSTLIRNVLEEAFDGGGGESGGSNSPKRVYLQNINSSMVAANRFPMVLGWDDIRLNRAMECSGCGKGLEPGSYVTLGIAAPGEERILLCDICKESL